MADLRGCGLALEQAVGIEELADTVVLESAGFRLEVAQSGSALWGDDQHMVIVPGRRQPAVEGKEAFSLEPLADVTLFGLQVSEGVLGIDGIDLQAETVLGFENRTRPNQKLDASGEFNPGEPLELGQDALGLRAPDDGVALGHQRHPVLAAEVLP